VGDLRAKSGIAKSSMEIAREAGYQAEQLSNRAIVVLGGCTLPRS
jgi:hypothetical protein